ncbi:MAG TPA: hypothetical protein VGM93_05530 [Acidimicrobiales bacterium]
MTTTLAPEPHAEAITDEELTALALAADPHAALAGDAVSLWDANGATDPGLLPDWYMPTTGTGPRTVRSWKKRAVLWTIVIALLLINAAGLCVTYGRVVIA